MSWEVGLVTIVLTVALSTSDTPQGYGIDVTGALIKKTDALSDFAALGGFTNTTELPKMPGGAIGFNNGTSLEKHRGCHPTISCTLAGGHCVDHNRDCDGTIDRWGCRGMCKDRHEKKCKCKCCIPDDTCLEKEMCSSVKKIYFSVKNIDDSVKNINGTVNDIDSTVKIIDGTVNNIDASVKNIDGIVNNIDASVKNINDSVNSIDGTVNGIDGTVKIIDGTVNNIDASVNNIDSSVNNIQDTVDMIDASVNMINDSVNDIGDGVNNIDGTVNDIDGTVNNIDVTVNDIDGTVNNIDTSVINIGGTVNNIDASVKDIDGTMMEMYDLLKNKGCPDGTFWFSQSNQCFKLLTDSRRTWHEGKAKCQEQGLVLARPYFPVSLREYLINRYGHDVEPWINGRGDGTNVVWQNDGEVITNDNPLWWPSQPGNRITTNNCLLIRARAIFWRENPDNPYYSSFCTGNRLLTLCEWELK